MMCRYLYRPYGRVDRTRLKSKLLNRCVEHGMVCFPDQYVAMNMLLELVQTTPTSERFKIAVYIVQHLVVFDMALILCRCYILPDES